jgi:phenylalanine-4-hydroxylase
MLMNPVIADFIQAYGEGGLRARRLGTLPLLARVYWYTVEFGLVKQSDGLRDEIAAWGWIVKDTPKGQVATKA